MGVKVAAPTVWEILKACGVPEVCAPCELQ